MRPFVPWTLLALFLAGSLPAQTNINLGTGTNAAPHRPGRYLLVIETSSAMRRRTENTQKAIGYLLARGLEGDLHAGDTIGVWTFNDELHTGDFPLQVWNPEKRTEIAKKAVDFFKRQKLEKDPHLERAFPSLKSLIGHSERITVLLLTSGENDMHGTPFDLALNETYKRSKDDLRKQKLPFVTVIRAWHGQVLGGSVTWAPWPVEFPTFPAEPKPIELPKPMEAETKPVTPHAPLIVVGSKPAESEPAAEPVAETPAQPPSESATPPAPGTAETQAIASASPPPTEPILETAKPQPAVAEQIKPMGAPAVPPAPVEPKPAARPRWLLPVSIGLLLAAGVLIYIQVRRSRRIVPVSLITRSMERRKK